MSPTVEQKRSFVTAENAVAIRDPWHPSLAVSTVLSRVTGASPVRLVGG
jgi:hypothetical protein